MAKANGWTLERRQRQAELIRNWKPWEHSTGPKTPDGKAASSKNAYRGGCRARERQIAAEVRAMWGTDALSRFLG